ncbi:histidine ammonia-lyase [Anaeromyxobacter dehalogenans]|uniref:Histidine ammonia-lyase n=1 Tax=Anaeromyxobacter dehalogenans (strain 2CP-C) TaxID=290397 RepID=HUTH_ANADE|nr:histidine ammonia-lyase [Anaeromyxobacter dehalogenans]Q2IIV4.1 RecName: Full=Histidine ammonia-lyase; Short=Histidase [Anaeromyxobacter dehalogenans 2CP-C]ABC81586.1 histidine ammonia-lyase [Anaeromyxobacter dehalogenans 2CP-C]
METLLLDGETLTLEQVRAVATGAARAALAPAARERVRRSRALVDARLEDGEAHYGINTGFGTLAEVRIPRADLERLQRNLVLSHAAGVGAPLPLAEARALVLLRANVLAKGVSGIRERTLELLLAMLERGVVPVVPERGSVGASGDLAPLAHLALVLIGDGEAFLAPPGAAAPPERLPGGEALRRAGLEPVVLQPKEGLALVNGTQAMAAVGTLALLRAERLAALADLAGAMTLEGLLGSHRPFAPEIQAARGQPGQIEAAAHLRALLAGSELNASHQGPGCHKVQDPYSLRCMPQVHGAARDGIGFCRGVLAREVNAATDNPLVFPDTGEIVSGGNFHGQPVALALDVLAVAASHLAAISERRVEQLVNPSLSGLPPFLAPQHGLNSGFMIAQVTSAALVSENKVLCHPASVDSIPSSAGREDHVSMGMTAALKARQVVENVRTCLAIELLVAAQALDLRAPLRPAQRVADAHARLRERVPHLSEDRALYRDIEAVSRLVDEGALEL